MPPIINPPLPRLVPSVLPGFGLAVGVTVMLGVLQLKMVVVDAAAEASLGPGLQKPVGLLAEDSDMSVIGMPGLSRESPLRIRRREWKLPLSLFVGRLRPLTLLANMPLLADMPLLKRPLLLTIALQIRLHLPQP